MNALLYALLLSAIGCSLQFKPSGFGIANIRPFMIHVTRLQCLDTPYKLINLRACEVKLRQNEPSRIFLEYDMPTLLDEMYTRFTMNYKIGNTFSLMLIDVAVELCSFLIQPPGVNLIADYVLDTVRAHVPHAVHSCPYGNRSYNFSDFSLNEKFLPDTLPAGEYRLDLLVQDKHNETMINVQCYLVVQSKGIA